jgi:hypothetical protein
LIVHVALIEKFHSQELLMSTRIYEEVLNSLDEQMKLSVDPVLYRPSEKIYFQVEF